MLRFALVALASFAALLVLLAPALRGPFLSDDFLYLTGNPYVQRPTPSALASMLDPTSEATTSVQNYAPLTLAVHAAAWQLFGDDPLGHHVLGLVLHALATALLVQLFLAAGIPLLASLLAGAAFLLHPANVEAVAWISQLKSTLCFALVAGALLCVERRPVAGTGLFLLALASKASALFAVPVLAAWAWLRPDRSAPADRRRRWIVVGVWALLALGWSALQLPANQHTNAEAPLLHADPLVRARSVVAIAGRYLAMAATGHGVSTLHEPAPALRWNDPWFVFGALALAALGARLAFTLRARREEAAWWIWAVAAFAPVSQIVPFLHPMADRYLYFILPGLMGGVLLAGRDALAGVRDRGTRRAAGGLLAAAGIASLVFFAVRSHERASVWSSPRRFTADAIEHYPNGTSARYQRAQALVQQADAAGAVRELRLISPYALEMNALLSDPVLQQLRGHPDFDALLREIAGRWIAWGERLESPKQNELRQIGMAHLVRAELGEARRSLERALEVGGPRDDEIRRDLAQLEVAEARVRALRSRKSGEAER